MELEEFRDNLEFHPEFQLSSEPLRIDCIIIKKDRDIEIKKNIAAIFRDVNLLEYKSPEDYLAVEDFYKVSGYVYLYAAFEKLPITSLTMSFIGSRNPRKLLAYLREERRFCVEETSPGIYNVKGDILPIQVIDNRKLSALENLWLKGLDNRLGTKEIQDVAAEIQRRGKAAKIKRYLDAITRANIASLQEALKMSKTTLTLEEVLEEAGLISKWEARGEAKGEEHKAVTVAKNLINFGVPMEVIAQATELEIEKVKALAQGEFA